MRLIDTHVHLEEKAFAGDYGQVIARAHEAAVWTMLNAGSAAEANSQVLELIQRHEGLFGSMGLHPHEFPGTAEPDWVRLREQLCQEKVVAVGEIGLDYHVFPDYPAPDREAQQAAFAQQLQLARIFELPLILHVREAFPDALALLKKHGPFRQGGVWHCYSGGPEYMQEALATGFYFGIGGPVTYPAAASLREVVRTVPGERLLLETDAPYLPPQSRRGQRNEPACVREVARACAEVRGCSLKQMAETTSVNARRLFAIAEEVPGNSVYDIQGHLYVNLTNRCSADCVFCPRQACRRVRQYDLRLQREPLAAEIIAAIGDPARYDEIVFCGFGEPLLRLPTLLQVARAVKDRGARVRVDTNGQADMIFNRDILPSCQGLVDEWSVSLNSAEAEQYARLVRPAGDAKRVHGEVADFIRRAVQQGFAVTVTAVERPEVDVALLKQQARKWGARYRGRIPERLGEPEDN
ncbi:YchF/TatD family DNA exonuclease [candidate division FCPU426 bacterium]|nr:YchF/TatD family DNA exonuclease [candidate division FCPU426 bacterium]